MPGFQEFSGLGNIIRQRARALHVQRPGCSGNDSQQAQDNEKLLHGMLCEGRGVRGEGEK